MQFVCCENSHLSDQTSVLECLRLLQLCVGCVLSILCAVVVGNLTQCHKYLLHTVLVYKKAGCEDDGFLTFDGHLPLTHTFETIDDTPPKLEVCSGSIEWFDSAEDYHSDSCQSQFNVSSALLQFRLCNITRANLAVFGVLYRGAQPRLNGTEAVIGVGGNETCSSLATSTETDSSLTCSGPVSWQTTAVLPESVCDVPFCLVDRCTDSIDIDLNTGKLSTDGRLCLHALDISATAMAEEPLSTACLVDRCGFQTARNPSHACLRKRCGCVCHRPAILWRVHVHLWIPRL